MQVTFNVSNNLVDYYQDNLTEIYDRVKKLSNIVETVFMPDELDVPNLIVEPINATMLNRSVYLWTNRVIKHLQVVVDWLVGVYNDYNLVDVQAGENTSTIKLWQPESLVIDDDYINKIKEDFEAVNGLLDRLFEYSKPYVKG